MRNYGKTMVYKIINTHELTDTNIYIGCATDLYRCKQNRKNRYNRGDGCNLYDHIRGTGGWEPQHTTALIALRPSRNSYEHIQELGPSLNVSNRKKDQKSYSNLSDF